MGRDGPGWGRMKRSGRSGEGWHGSGQGGSLACTGVATAIDTARTGSFMRSIAPSGCAAGKPAQPDGDQERRVGSGPPHHAQSTGRLPRTRRQGCWIRRFPEAIPKSLQVGPPAVVMRTWPPALPVCCRDASTLSLPAARLRLPHEAELPRRAAAGTQYAGAAATVPSRKRVNLARAPAKMTCREPPRDTGTAHHASPAPGTSLPRHTVVAPPRRWHESPGQTRADCRYWWRAVREAPVFQALACLAGLFRW